MIITVITIKTNIIAQGREALEFGGYVIRISIKKREDSLNFEDLAYDFVKELQTSIGLIRNLAKPIPENSFLRFASPCQSAF